MQSVAELPFVAGHVALDFVNTAEERGHPQAGDALCTPDDLRLWGQRYGLISRAAEKNEQAELGRAREARELLYAIFLARVHGTPTSAAEFSRLAKFAATAYGAGSLHPADDGGFGWRWRPSELASIRHIAVTSAVDLLRTDLNRRLKRCPGEHCGWFFLDTTKRGNRRWCSMNECGQDAKDQRRRARRQACETEHHRTSHR